MKITKKSYRCPTCGNMEIHDTNHFGEIYCPCKVCGAMVLYCNEPYAIADFEERDQTKAVIHWYFFNIDKAEQLEAYMILRKGLRDLNRSGHSAYVPYSYKEALKKHAGNPIIVYSKSTFDNQFISSVGRIHYWQEFQFDNLDLREGYWLEFIN